MDEYGLQKHSSESVDIYFSLSTPIGREEREAAEIEEAEERQGGLAQKRKLSWVKVGIAKSTSAPPLTMETGLELSECSPLSNKKKNFQIVERGNGRMERERDEGVKERGRERREDGRKGQPKWEAEGRERELVKRKKTQCKDLGEKGG